MTTERSQAYGRVVKTLADMGPTKLQKHEEEAIRHAVDTLLFASSMEPGTEAADAVREIGTLLERLVEADRWLFESADRLLRDVEDCGPGLLPAIAESELLGV
jgi:hypothetical protein